MREFDVIGYTLRCLDDVEAEPGDIIIVDSPSKGLYFAEYNSSHRDDRVYLTLFHNRNKYWPYSRYCYRLELFKERQEEYYEDEPNENDLLIEDMNHLSLRNRFSK